jgi:hypothetical protein
MLNEWTALAIAAITVAATLILSWAFLPVENFATWVVKQMDRLLNRKPKAALATS